jgi:hypothetical protein
MNFIRGALHEGYICKSQCYAGTKVKEAVATFAGDDFDDGFVNEFHRTETKSPIGE